MKKQTLRRPVRPLRDRPVIARGAFVKPIVLGGKYVLPFDPATEPKIDIPEPPRIILNVEQILEDAGLDPDEIQYLRLTRIEGVARCDVHQNVIGWSRSKVDRVHKSITAKIRAGLTQKTEARYITGSSVALAFRQELECGRVWALGTVASTQTFHQEMNASRIKSLAIRDIPASPQSRHLIGARLRIMKRKLIDVQDTLRAERLKLAAVLEKSHNADLETYEAQAELESLKAAAALEAELKILDEDHKSDANLPRRIAQAEKRVADALTREAAFDGALKRQHAKVETLEEEIAARKTEAFRLDLGSAPQEIAALLRQLAAKACEIERTAMKHQRHGTELAAELFPFDLSGDPYSGLTTARIASIGAFNAALKLGAEINAGRTKAA